MGLREGGRARTRKLDAGGTHACTLRVNTLGLTHSFFKFEPTSKFRACFVFTYRRPNGSEFDFGIQNHPGCDNNRVTPSEVQPIFPGCAAPGGEGGQARETEIASALEGRGLETSYAQRLWARSTTYVKKEEKNYLFFLIRY